MYVAKLAWMSLYQQIKPNKRKNITHCSNSHLQVINNLTVDFKMTGSLSKQMYRLLYISATQLKISSAVFIFQ